MSSAVGAVPDASSFRCCWLGGWKSSKALCVYSDWTIIIVNNDNNETAEYFVHRLVLGQGPRQSGYFETLFASKLDTPEQLDNTSFIELDNKSAKLFPALLDFIYTGELDSSIKQQPDDLFVLFSLAEYFAIATLKTTLMEICHQNVFYRCWQGKWKVDVEQLAIYLSKAEENPGITGNLYNSLIEECADLVKEIPEYMADKLKPKFLLAILESYDFFPPPSEDECLDDNEMAADRLVPRCLLSHMDDDDMLDAETVDRLLGCTSGSLTPQNAVRLLTILNRVEVDCFDEHAEYHAFLASLQEEEEASSKDESGDGDLKSGSCGAASDEESVETGDEEQDPNVSAGDEDSMDESDTLDAIAKLGPSAFSDEHWERAKDAVIHADAILDTVDCEEESFVSDSTGGSSLWHAERQNCIDTITSGWKELCEEEDDEMIQLITNLDGHVLFAMTRQAKRELEQSSRR